MLGIAGLAMLFAAIVILTELKLDKQASSGSNVDAVVETCRVLAISARPRLQPLVALYRWLCWWRFLASIAIRDCRRLVVTTLISFYFIACGLSFDD